MKNLLNSAVFTLMAAIIAFSGCEAGLSQSSGSSDDSSEFSFSDMYSKFSVLQNDINSLTAKTEEQEIIISNLDSSQTSSVSSLQTSVTDLENSVTTLETNLQTTNDDKNIFSGNIGIGTDNPRQSLDIAQPDSSIFLSGGVNAVIGDGHAVLAGEGRVSIIADCNSKSPVELILFGGGYKSSSYSQEDAASTSWPTGEPYEEWMRINRGTLTVSGPAYATNFSQTSDIRYKKDITPLTGSLNKILSLQGVSYNWKREQFKEKYFSKKRQIGFIAQDVEKIFPELVETDEKGYKSVSYGQFTALLVEAVKELKQENRVNNNKISSLEKENTRLKKKATSLESMNKRILALERKLKNDSVKTAYNYR